MSGGALNKVLVGCSLKRGRTGGLEVAGGDVAIRYEGRGGLRVGGWTGKGGDVPGGLDDVFAGQVGPFCIKVWDIHPP